MEPPRARRIRVLALIRDIWLSEGGAERLAVELARRLDQTQFESYLCVSRAPDPTREGATREAVAALQDAGVSVLALERESSLQLLPWRRLYSLLRRERIDVLHSHMFRSSVPGTILGRLSRVPVVISHEHSWSFEGRPVRRLVDRNLIARGSDAFVAVSDDDRQLMIDVERIPPAKIRLVRNGIPPLPPGHAEHIRKELGIAPNDPLVGAIGVLRKEKAFGVLIAAADLLAKDIPNLRVIIAGTGPEKAALEHLIATLGLEQTVTLIGQRRDVPDILAALDVAVLCSNREGGPLAMKEYMAAAKPIVATSVGGIPELIEDGVHGLLVDSQDPPALAGAIGRLLRDRELGAQLGAEARKRQLAELGIDAMVRRFEELYVELYEAATAS